MEDTQRRAERRRKELRRKRAKQRLIIVGSFTLVVGLVVGSVVGGLFGKAPLKKEVTKLSAELKKKDKELETAQLTLTEQQQEKEEEPVELPWNLTLVNKWNEMEEGYVPNLVEIEQGHEVDSRIADAAKEMLEDARAAGLSPFICSSYRSVERQEELFNSGVKKRIGKLGYYDAYIETATVVAVPGTSEHALGLAIDIVAVSNQNLNESQEETAEAKWLMENCYKYGFILRYPNGTTDITGIIYEPWHYRYVGVEVATEITELGITLEEYLEEHYEP